MGKLLLSKTIQKCLTEEQEILNRWTEHCPELYIHKANGNQSVLNCPQTDTVDNHPILRKEVAAAVHTAIIEEREVTGS